MTPRAAGVAVPPPAVGVVATPAVAGIQDFIVQNNSGVTVTYVYVSADYEDTWSPDVLGSNVLYPGQELQIQVNGYGDHCWFDVLIEDETGGSIMYDDVDLCSVLYLSYP